jgi:hypothetical protein
MILEKFRRVFEKFRGADDFQDLFSLREIRRICPWDCGPGRPASSHGFTGFIKRRSLIRRSASKIYHRDGFLDF